MSSQEPAGAFEVGEYVTLEDGSRVLVFGDTNRAQRRGNLDTSRRSRQSRSSRRAEERRRRLLERRTEGLYEVLGHSRDNDEGGEGERYADVSRADMNIGMRFQGLSGESRRRHGRRIKIPSPIFVILYVIFLRLTHAMGMLNYCEEQVRCRYFPFVALEFWILMMERFQTTPVLPLPEMEGVDVEAMNLVIPIDMILIELFIYLISSWVIDFIM